MSAPPLRERSRFGLLLAAGQVGYQVRLLLRTPIATFTALVIPVMLLVALNVVNPSTRLHDLQGIRYAEFVTPAMATFALINACYVNVITSVVIARENGILKRLHGTPLPLWAYVVGRIAAAAAVAVASMGAVYGIGWVFLDVDLTPHRVVMLSGVAALGIACFTIVGLAVSTIVPRPETALPIAYGTVLPLAFISDVFFPATHAPEWLRHLSGAFPLAPIARSTEAVFTPGASGWPMTNWQLIVTLAWIGGAIAVTAAGFRWQPGASPIPLTAGRR